MDEVLDGLRSLLLLRERHLQDLTGHAAGGAGVLGGIANEIHLLREHDVVDGPEGAIERYLHWVLEWLEVRRLADDLIGRLLVLSFFWICLPGLRLPLWPFRVVVGWLTVADFIDFVVFLI